MKNLKPFNLEHALKTRRAKDDRGNICRLKDVNIYSGFLRWSNQPGNIKFCFDSDFEGKILSMDDAFMHSAEVDRFTSITHALKHPGSKDIQYFKFYKRDAASAEILYKIMLNFEDDELVSIDFNKVE